jgi:hypothetical protein
MALPVTITGISTAVAPVGPFKSTGGAYYFFGRDGTTATTLQAYKSPVVVLGSSSAVLTAVNADGGAENFGTTGQPGLGQSFTTDNSTWYLTSISDLRIRKQNAPTDNVVIQIFAFDTGTGLPTGPVLATSQGIPAASITTTLASYTATFATPFQLAPNTKYAFRYYRSGSLDSTNCYLTTIPAAAGSYAGGNYHFWSGSVWTNSLGKDVNFTINAATDVVLNGPDTAWASIATKTGFTTAILGLSSYQVGNVIHIAVMDGTLASSIAHKYVSFDMATDTFLATTETIMAAANPAGQVAGAGAGNSIVVRSGGEVVAFFNSLQTNTSGTPRARVSYSRRTAVNTWAAAVRVDANTATDNVSPFAVLGAANRVHFFWNNQTGIGYRTLSAANALNTGGASASISNPGDGVSYDRAGTTKVVVISNGAGGQTVGRFDSSDNPTPTIVNLAIAVATVPHRVGAFPNTDDVTIVYRSSADSDLYSITSSDDGATFASPVSFFVGTVASADANLSRNASGGVYQRGSQNVVGYIVNDGGTLKYNEYVISSVGISLTADKGSVTLAGVATGLRADRRMTAGTAMIAVAGPATGVSKGYLLGSSAGAVTITRYDANLLYKHFYTLPITVGAVTVAFNDANLVKVGAKQLTADTGAVTFAGYAAGLRGGRGVLASKGSVTLAGQAATLRHTHVLTATTGAVTLSGKAATLRHASIMPAAVGAVTLTGYAADLRKAGSVGMVASTGTVTVALQSATLRRTIKMPAATGTVTLSGEATTLRYGQMLTAAQGAVTLAGQAATLRRTTVMPAATGAVTVTGVDATLRLRQFYRLLAAPGGIVVTGVPVALSTATHKTLAAATGAVALSGKAITLRHGWALPAATAPITVTGVAVDLTHVARVHYRISVTPGEFALYGQPANLLANVREKQPGPLVFGRRLVVIPGRW